MRLPLITLLLAGKLSAVAVWLFWGDFWLGFVLFSAPAMPVLYHLLVPGAQGLGAVQTRFATTRKEIWLTIDDGPDAHDTPRILELLAQQGARAVFFLIGERAAQQPELVSAILEGGHEIGHHTQTHPAGTFWCSSAGRVRRELDQALAVFAKHGVRPRWFRPPVGIKNLWLAPALRHRGLHHLGWSVRSMDTVGTCPVAVAARVMQRLQPGDIVLVHEGVRLHPSVRVEALALLLRDLGARGFSCVLPSPLHEPVLPGRAGAGAIPSPHPAENAPAAAPA